MTDPQRISKLSPITEAAATDRIPIVDVPDVPGGTKRIDASNLNRNLATTTAEDDASKTPTDLKFSPDLILDARRFGFKSTATSAANTTAMQDMSDVVAENSSLVSEIILPDGAFSMATQVNFLNTVTMRGAGIKSTIITGETTDSALRFIGSRTLIGSITTPPGQFESVFAITTTTGIAVGDYIQIFDAVSTWEFDAARNSRAGQISRITDISGLNVTVDDFLWSNYTLVDGVTSTTCEVYILNTISPHVRDFSVSKLGILGQGISFNFCLDPLIERIGVKDTDTAGINLNTGIGGRISSCLVEDHGTVSSTGYGIFVQQWNGATVAYNRMNRGRAGVDISGETISRNTLVLGNQISDHTERSIGSHASSQFNRYIWNSCKNSDSQGIYNRGPDFEVTGNFIQGTTLVAIQADFMGGKCVIRDNRSFEFRRAFSATLFVGRGIDMNTQETVSSLIIENNELPFETDGIRLRTTTGFAGAIVDDMRITEKRMRSRVVSGRTAIRIGDGTLDPVLNDPIIEIIDANAATRLLIDSGVTVNRPRFKGVDTFVRSGAGGIPLTNEHIDIETTGTDALTLGDGIDGQEMYLTMSVDGGVGTLTPTNLANGTTITFDDVGDNADLRFYDSTWNFLGGTATLTGNLVATPSEVVTTTNIITAVESGTTYYLNAVGGFTSTLPAPAIGLNYKFIVSTAPTTAYIITTNAGANLLFGFFLDIVGEQVYFSAQDTLNFVASASLVGDFLEVESDGTNWYCVAKSGADGGITVAVT